MHVKESPGICFPGAYGVAGSVRIVRKPTMGHQLEIGARERIGRLGAGSTGVFPL